MSVPITMHVQDLNLQLRSHLYLNVEDEAKGKILVHSDYLIKFNNSIAALGALNPGSFDTRTHEGKSEGKNHNLYLMKYRYFSDFKYDKPKEEMVDDYEKLVQQINIGTPKNKEVRCNLAWEDTKAKLLALLPLKVLLHETKLPLAVPRSQAEVNQILVPTGQKGLLLKLLEYAYFPELAEETKRTGLAKNLANTVAKYTFHKARLSLIQLLLWGYFIYPNNPKSGEDALPDNSNITINPNNGRVVRVSQPRVQVPLTKSWIDNDLKSSSSSTSALVLEDLAKKMWAAISLTLTFCPETFGDLEVRYAHDYPFETKLLYPLWYSRLPTIKRDLCIGLYGVTTPDQTVVTNCLEYERLSPHALQDIKYPNARNLANTQNIYHPYASSWGELVGQNVGIGFALLYFDHGSQRYVVIREWLYNDWPQLMPGNIVPPPSQYSTLTVENYALEDARILALPAKSAPYYSPETFLASTFASSSSSELPRLSSLFTPQSDRQSSEPSLATLYPFLISSDCSYEFSSEGICLGEVYLLLSDDAKQESKSDDDGDQHDWKNKYQQAMVFFGNDTGTNVRTNKICVPDPTPTAIPTEDSKTSESSSLSSLSSITSPKETKKAAWTPKNYGRNWSMWLAPARWPKIGNSETDDDDTGNEEVYFSFKFFPHVVVAVNGSGKNRCDIYATETGGEDAGEKEYKYSELAQVAPDAQSVVNAQSAIGPRHPFYRFNDRYHFSLGTPAIPFMRDAINFGSSFRDLRSKGFKFPVTEYLAVGHSRFGINVGEGLSPANTKNYRAFLASIGQSAQPPPPAQSTQSTQQPTFIQSVSPSSLSPLPTDEQEGRKRRRDAVGADEELVEEEERYRKSSQRQTADGDELDEGKTQRTSESAEVESAETTPETVEELNQEPMHYYYFMYYYTFDPVTFQLRRMSHSFLPPNHRPYHLVFPVGICENNTHPFGIGIQNGIGSGSSSSSTSGSAVVDNGPAYTVSYGEGDIRCKLLTMSAADIDKMLFPIEEMTMDPEFHKFLVF